MLCLRIFSNEGQPGNQGGSNGTSNGQKGYEGQPGNQGGH
jgi:hypothetical protein